MPLEDAWEPRACRHIAKSLVCLFFNFCDALAPGAFSPEARNVWFGKWAEERKATVDAMEAATESDVTDVAGLVAECYLLLQDSIDGADLGDWLVQTTAMICNRFAPPER